MRAVHVLLKKEEINEEQLAGGIAVVLDVIFATSTIVTALYHGAKAVVPVFDSEEALLHARGYEEGTYLLAGEDKGYPLEGFAQPSPLRLVEAGVSGKTVIYSTTNGTVALRKSVGAKQVMAASLLNGRCVAELLAARTDDAPIWIICSGSQGNFNMEDFYGAGYLVGNLMQCRDDWDLNDAAKAAMAFYQAKANDPAGCLLDSRVGQFVQYMGYEEEVHYAAQEGILSVVPVLQGGRLVINQAD